jgi:hypothetical protein
MIVDESEAAKLAQFIFNNVRVQRWLYWPPGPMTSQVFDVDQCKKDLIRYLEGCSEYLQVRQERQ